MQFLNLQDIRILFHNMLPEKIIESGHWLEGWMSKFYLWPSAANSITSWVFQICGITFISLRCVLITGSATDCILHCRGRGFHKSRCILLIILSSDKIRDLCCHHLCFLLWAYCFMAKTAFQSSNFAFVSILAWLSFWQQWAIQKQIYLS